MRSYFTLSFVLLLLACGEANSLRGFPEVDVTAAPTKPASVVSCEARNGRLVVEVERVLVREYPNFGSVPKGHGQRPLLVVTLESVASNPVSTEAAVLMAPAGYQPGDTVEYFRGRRILDRPLRHVAHRRLTIRLMENDSSSPPEWVQVVSQIRTISPAGALVGLNVPGAVISDGAWLIAQLDPDDLVMAYPLDTDPLMANLGHVEERRALRLRGVTPRLAAGANARAPVAEMELLAYLEPEPGC